jgi:hypothetical protein
MSSEKLQWHQEFVSTAAVEYRIIPVPAETGGAIVFQAIVKDESGAKLLGQLCKRIEQTFERCDEDVDRRRAEYHDSHPS